MDVSFTRYCLSLLLLTVIRASANSNETDLDSREPRVSGRIVKLYSGTKPEPYVCRGDGFQPDSSNCAAFYRCVKEKSGKFTVFKYQCAPGTVYDPDLETCNFPRNTRRSECGGMLAPTPQPTQTANVNEIDGAQSEMPRPISTKEPMYSEQTTFKNPTTLSWIFSTQHQNTPIKTHSEHTTPFSSTTLNMNRDKTTKFSSSTLYPELLTTFVTQAPSSPNKFQQPQVPNNDPCTSDGFMGDSENCRKFYRCVRNQNGGYIKYEFSCSELTVWDDDIQGCNHPWAVKRSKCGRSLSYNDKYEPNKLFEDLTTQNAVVNRKNVEFKSDRPIQQQLQISHGSHSKITQTQVQINKNDNVIQNQTQIHYGDRINDKNYPKLQQNQTQINHGNAVSQTQTQIDYGSKGIQSQLQIDHSDNSSQSQVQIQDFTTAQYTSTEHLHNTNGDNKCTASGFMGDEKDCKKFYRCVDNGRGTYTRFEYKCGEGTVWDPEIDACNHAWAVKHCGGTSSTDITKVETASSTTSTPKPTLTYTDSKVTDTEDENNVGYGHQNNHQTMPSSIASIKTTTPKTTSSNEEISNEAATECKSNGFIGDANDCKRFYRCVETGEGKFMKYEFKCGEGTMWDSSIEACNHAWAVKQCGGNNSYNTSGDGHTTTTTTKSTEYYSEPTRTTQGYTDIDSEYDVSYGNQNNQASTSPHLTTSTTTIQSTSTTSSAPNGESNECTSNGFMSDSNDCQIFYRCVDNGNGSYTKYEFKCGDGTLWDPDINACNHKWAVKRCGGSNSSSVDKEDTTSEHETSSTIPQTTVTLIQVTNQPETQNNENFNSSTATTTKQPGEQNNSNNNNECNSSGFMGDRNDCKKFYRCVNNGDGNYIRYEFTCGEGTVWDPKIEACNHAWAVEKCGGSNHNIENVGTSSQPEATTNTANASIIYTTQASIDNPTFTKTTTIISSSTVQSNNECSNSGFMGDNSDCKKFYRCVDNGDGSYTRYEFTCGEGTVWDSKIEACNHGWAVEKCGGSSGPTSHGAQQITSQGPPMQDEVHDNNYVTQSSETSRTPQDFTSTSQSYELTHTSSELQESVHCSKSGFMGDKNNCKKFYRCVDNGNGGYDRYEFMCGEGTLWDDSIEACNHAWAVKSCGTSGSTTNQEQNDHSPSVSSSTEDYYAQQSTVKLTSTTQMHHNSDISDDKCTQEGFFGSKNDCKNFYRCVVNGQTGFTKYDFSCGDGTIWNQEIQACDHQSQNAKCAESASHPSQASSTLPESTTVLSITTNKQETTDKNDSSESMNTVCKSEGFYSHPDDCRKFIRCVNNGNGGYTRYEFSCGEGTVWVQEIQACDHDNDVMSCSSQGSSTSKPQSNVEHPTTLPSVSSSSSTASSTPIREDDEYDAGVSNEPSHDETDNCNSEGFFPNKQDCKKFYRCVDNGNGGYTKYDFVCGEGTAWDSNIQTCNHINEVQSCSGQDGNDNQQTTTNKNQASTENITSSTQASTSTSSGSSISNNEDECEREGYFGNSKDCKKFYRCVDNGKGGYTKYDFTCGEGTIWDQDITTCNHPQDVSNPSCSTEQGNGGSSTATSSTSSSLHTTSSSTDSNNNQNSSEYSEESSKKPQNNVTCDKAGYYANPNDCKKFYRCVDWDGDGKRFSVFHFECGEGTIWDPALDTCNYEESVYPPRDCSQSQSQNVGETTTSKSTTEDNSSEKTSTQEPTTIKQTTTEQYTTTDKTTTEPSTTSEQTTSEQTTTQQSTTSEKTTTEPQEQTTSQQTTASDKTTTQESTPSEQTTTEQSVTSEKTTTQVTTTTEKETTTSAQELTTSEQTTTSKTTTQDINEQTTTQQSTTSEKTTTNEPTTSESTTTQESTTSNQSNTTTNEPTTTQESTTSEQTTMQQSSTNENSTTQQSTTTEEATTQQSTSKESTTTEQMTTQPVTTTEQTTQETTTSEQTTTTQENTTSEQGQLTTQESSSNEQTTEQFSTTTEQMTEGTANTEETTNPSTTEATSTESDSTESSTTESSSIDDKCPETEDDQYLFVCPTSFRRHPKYCNMFYQCTEDEDTNEAKLAMFKCPNNTIYDESKTQCVQESKADKKCDGEMANKRRFKRLNSNYRDPIVADYGKQSCTNAGYFSFEKQSECSKGFLKCEKSKNGRITGYVYQCPDGYIYWSISKRCEKVESVRDCKRSFNDWTGRWNIPMERKNIAVS